MSDTITTDTTQIYRVWIKATPQAVWDAITAPAWTDRYGYGGLPNYGDFAPGTEYEIQPGEGMKAAGVVEAIVDGTLIEATPPSKFVVTWRMLMDPSMAAEPHSTVTYDIDELPNGLTRLTVTHELEGAPITGHLVAGGSEDQGAGGGWGWILSDLKTLLETGSAMGR